MFHKVYVDGVVNLVKELPAEKPVPLRLIPATDEQERIWGSVFEENWMFPDCSYSFPWHFDDKDFDENMKDFDDIDDCEVLRFGIVPADTQEEILADCLEMDALYAMYELREKRAKRRERTEAKLNWRVNHAKQCCDRKIPCWQYARLMNGTRDNRHKYHPASKEIAEQLADFDRNGEIALIIELAKLDCISGDEILARQEINECEVRIRQIQSLMLSENNEQERQDHGPYNDSIRSEAVILRDRITTLNYKLLQIALAKSWFLENIRVMEGPQQFFFYSSTSTPKSKRPTKKQLRHKLGKLERKKHGLELTLRSDYAYLISEYGAKLSRRLARTFKAIARLKDRLAKYEK